MNSWILIVAMLAPNGDFLGKDTLEFKNQEACERARVKLLSHDQPFAKYRGVCVTRDHWTGKKKMPSVALD